MWMGTDNVRIQDNATLQEYAAAMLSGNVGLALGIARANSNLFDVDVVRCGTCTMEGIIVSPPATRGTPLPEHCPLCTMLALESIGATA